MMKIAVICAFNPNENTGMYTVDESAKRFFSDVSQSDVDFYAIGDVTRFSDGQTTDAIQYQALQEEFDTVLKADRIVFWGDFHHSWTYWDSDLAVRMVQHGIAANKGEAIDYLYKYLLLENADSAVLAKVVICGTTMLPDRASDLTVRFKEGVERLIKTAKSVYFRDAVTAARYSYLRPGDALYGVDCAYLHSFKKLKRPENTGAIGFYLGRSGRVERLKFTLFARSLTKIAAKKALWIQWLPIKRRDKLDSFLISGDRHVKFSGGEDTVDQLFRCDFIVTDVYHMAINALARGIPAILLGYGAAQDSDTVGSKKKEIMFFQFGNQGNYVYWEDLRIGTYGKQARSALENITNENSNANVFYNIESAAETTYRRLSADFSSM